MSKRNVVHVEIPAADMKAAGKFYQDLFDWKIEHIPEMNYALWEAADHTGGGFNPLGPDVKPGDVIVYIDSDDIDADLKKVEQLGGKVIRAKTEIPGIGWFGVFCDPTGNLLALYTSVNPEFNK